MAIKKIRVSNFASFEDMELELGDFNVLIGPNASGKSNVIRIFKFLRDIGKSGLENAVSLQGGVEYLRNLNIGSSENLSISVVFDEVFGRFGRISKEYSIGVEIYETTYEFALKFNKRGVGFKIVNDKLTQKCNFVRLVEQEEKFEKKEKLGKGKIIVYRANGKVKIDLEKPEKVPIERDDLSPLYFDLFEEHETLEPHTLLFQTPLLFLPPYLPPFDEIFSDIAIYDFDPRLPKKSTPITGMAELEEDGHNLSIVIKNIIKSKKKRTKFFNLVQDLLPFIDKLEVEKFTDKSMLFKLREIYSKKHYLPAFLISDGTINVTALIIALYFEEKQLTIIEEPERNIHPALISKMVDMMKDASKKKQIIVTTHNPEMVKYAGLENMLLVSRNKEGFSTISRPLDNEEVRTFLENEIGIEELYVQNLLGD